jgi:hypothetical protein
MLTYPLPGERNWVEMEMAVATVTEFYYFYCFHPVAYVQLTIKNSAVNATIFSTNLGYTTCFDPKRVIFRCFQLHIINELIVM